ncbi:MarR family transcriptional regulator [Nocardioides sp. GY 10113]|uniref:MarR family winged helix-turn-helix transcriptional regulator n=1 Tax=Nocardioides sp. GY 10113 TaxID=2569761 RepID=UPI0010A8C17D|nr:MarR family transcriptional regulator [Nocardioides sp. GY 10113]TIC85127.1 MarR family transcriptional regulator [Nocardioides sp. GY 10113]
MSGPQATTARDVDLADIEFEAMILGRHLAPRDAAYGLHLDKSAYTLITRLQVDGPMSIGQLSDAFGLDASTLNRQTAKMVEQGLVRRIPDPDGGLARKFEVTEQGAAHLAHDRRRKLAGLGEVLRAWPEEDVAALAELLRRFNGSIEERDGRPWPRP